MDAPSESKPYVRKATYEDAKSLAPRLRAVDRQEIVALDRNPSMVLFEAMECCTKVFSIIDTNGQVVGMFGVSPFTLQTGLTVGAVWLLGSDELKNIRFTFLRECSHWIDELHADHPVLWNWAFANNTLHLRWLQWLGFKIVGTAPIGKRGEIFHQFIKVK